MVSLEILRHKIIYFPFRRLIRQCLDCLSIIEKTLQTVNTIVPEVKYVHHTGNRNSFITQLIANYEALFGTLITLWHILEVGHGKGPCNGVGGA